jgi:phosphoribosylformylglycinamidine synthase I
MKKAAIITFPGSNCNRDMGDALRKHFDKVVEIWHQDTEISSDIDLITIPGGFSYGDYLRSGAMAANAPLMQKIKDFANQGGYVLGVCNGFQILTEAGLLPGVLLRNKKLKFISKIVTLNINNNDSAFTADYKDKQIDIPIAHHDGNYFCSTEQLAKLHKNKQIAFTYQDNPNGSIDNIAGIFNESRNILGMMPHPERAIDQLLGSADGNALFSSLSISK